MQKIETWRVKELSFVLEHLSELLRKGDNYEWANVFFHFRTESQNILLSKTFDVEQLKRLLQNIKNCFSRTSTLNHLVLQRKGSADHARINEDFQVMKARLLKILEDMEQRTVEHIH
ncbi:MAG: hypothetical protein ACE5L7_00800 [Candidatus Aminicenantales bacterium]